MRLLGDTWRDVASMLRPDQIGAELRTGSSGRVCRAHSANGRSRTPATRSSRTLTPRKSFRRSSRSTRTAHILKTTGLISVRDWEQRGWMLGPGYSAVIDAGYQWGSTHCDVLTCRPLTGENLVRCPWKRNDFPHAHVFGRSLWSSCSTTRYARASKDEVVRCCTAGLPAHGPIISLCLMQSRDDVWVTTRDERRRRKWFG